MVVRSLGGKDHTGFAVDGSRATTMEQTFDLGKITTELKAHLDNFEKRRHTTFYQKKDEIDQQALSVAAFVQDTKTMQVLQAAFVKVGARSALFSRP